MTERQRLWDVDHPYYCNEGNYFASGCGSHFSRWQDFLAAEGDADLDMNLVFRWDWVAPREDDEPDKPIQWHSDEYYRDCTLKLFYMGQRKGLFRYTTIDVCRADEPAVRDWLEVRFVHMLRLWAPFAAAPDLLDALQNIVSVGREFYDMDCGENGAAAIEQAEAAIAKALGE